MRLLLHQQKRIELYGIVFALKYLNNTGRRSMNKLYDQFSFMETALQLRSKRQQVIASNIANADTPNYKARAMDFSGALKAAIGESNMSLRAAQDDISLSRTNKRHFAYEFKMDADPFIGYRKEFQPSIDNNTVDMDIERANFADNTAHYEAILTFLSTPMREHQAAIQTS